MPAFDIAVQTDEQFVAQVADEWVARVVQTVLDAEQQSPETTVTVVITDDARIQQLNRDYREVDSPTDVLAFAANEGEEFVLPEGVAPYLGDVIISYPTALAQAAEQGQPVEAELALLIVHGCLHLLSYDHATDEEREIMWTRQAAILRSLG